MIQVAPRTWSILRDDLGVDRQYTHTPKRITPGEMLELPDATFKWSDVSSEEFPVPSEIGELARNYLVETPPDARGLGFVILHRCGRDFYFLIVNTWRGNNELWETVFYKNGDAMSDFALFRREELHKPTFCVWELAAVWHEKQAWERFLKSARDATAAEDWLQDRYVGPA